MLSDDYNTIDRLIADNRLGDAISALRKYKAENAGIDEDDQYWFLMGKAAWKEGRRDLALSYYNRAVSLNPASPAHTAIELAADINEFFNPDIYNP